MCFRFQSKEGTAMTSLELVVNPIACDGVGLCAVRAAGVITLDKWGYPILRAGAIGAAENAAAIVAVKSCPRRALSLIAEPSRG